MWTTKKSLDVFGIAYRPIIKAEKIRSPLKSVFTLGGHGARSRNKSLPRTTHPIQVSVHGWGWMFRDFLEKVTRGIRRKVDFTEKMMIFCCQNLRKYFWRTSTPRVSVLMPNDRLISPCTCLDLPPLQLVVVLEPRDHL